MSSSWKCVTGENKIWKGLNNCFFKSYRDVCRGRAVAVMLFKSTAVHIPLLGQCCFFNVSASCLWVFESFIKFNWSSSSLSLILQLCLPSQSLYHIAFVKSSFQLVWIYFSAILSQMCRGVGGKGKKNVQVGNCLELPQSGPSCCL